MLMISPTASSAIAAALAPLELPDGAGLRLAASQMTDRGVLVDIVVVDAPLPEDQVIETGTGSDVFVEPGTAELLGDQRLDVDVEAGEATFSLRPQAPEWDGGPPGGSPGE